ncbi:unnamed protein product, partial [Oppiella nova]
MAANRSLHEPSGGYLQKRHSGQHLSPTNIPGTRVYPYPGTTQEPVVRNSYHHSIPHHMNPLYGAIGSNSGHSGGGGVGGGVGPQQAYRDGNYTVDNRHEFSPMDRYRNRNESLEMHHSSGGGVGGGAHSHAPPTSVSASGHSQAPPLSQQRRRPSLLPPSHVPNEYSMLGAANSALTSSYLSRERYDLASAYRYPQYDSQTKGAGLQSAAMSMTSAPPPVNQHTGPPPMHLVPGLHLPLGYGSHQTQQAMV